MQLRGNRQRANRPMAGAAWSFAVGAALLCLSAAPGRAEPPKQTTAFGLALGQTPATVESLLSKRYPGCGILPSYYHETPEYPSNVTALFDIARGTLDECIGPPEGKDLKDSLTVIFTHPSIAESQPAYQIDIDRNFPDPALVRNGKIVYSFDQIRAELFRIYGRPTEERKESINSAAASLESSVLPNSKVRREDYRIRYLWATNGHVSDNLEVPICDCGARYVEAFLEISRSPSTNPKNQYFVLFLHVFIRDAELGARQDKWNAQWQKVAR
jgi:hypothetical protein